MLVEANYYDRVFHTVVSFKMYVLGNCTGLKKAFWSFTVRTSFNLVCI